MVVFFVREHPTKTQYLRLPPILGRPQLVDAKRLSLRCAFGLWSPL